MDELWARYTSETANERAAITNDLFIEIYGKTHLCPFFGTVGGITSARAADYIRKRMASVFSRTVKKELSALRTCLSWCEEQGYVDTAPIIPRPPRRALGTPFKQRRRGKATEVSLEDVRAVINELPEWSESRKVSRFPIRSRMIVAFETTLRPATLNKLSVPEHYRRGAATLTITDEIDKARFGRQLPLSDETRAALDSIIPESGLIFGRHDYRVLVKKAAEAVLTKEQAKTFTQYDLRHARITQLAETGNLPGVAFIAGHVQASTTSGYIHSNRNAAERTLASAGPTGFAEPTPNPATQLDALAGVANPADDQTSCEGEDLNLHGSYPASTSIQRQFQFIDVFSVIRCTKRHENAKARTHNRETIRETF